LEALAPTDDGHEGHAAKMVSDLMDETAVIDSIGTCTFVTPVTFTQSPEAYKAVLGKDITEAEMRAVGRRITDLERWLDTERGLSKAEDTLPVRFLEEAVDVNGKAVVLGPVHGTAFGTSTTSTAGGPRRECRMWASATHGEGPKRAR